MKITLAQINPVVGDIHGNLDLVLARLPAAREAGADLVVFPEMCLSGYPPRDLVERSTFVAAAEAALDRLVERSRKFPGMGVVVGLPVATRRSGGKGVANAAALVCDGKVLHVQQKSLLPTYDVFDEARYFDPAKQIDPVAFKGETIGLTICEDAWNDTQLLPRPPYDIDPVAVNVEKGATLLVNVSASPFTVEKEALRLDLSRAHATRHRRPFVLVNQVGGNDELIFDGRSLFVGGDGEARAVLPMFEEASETVDTRAPGDPLEYECVPEVESIRRALVLGTRDYLRKCGFSQMIVGLSGGIDSAVTLAVAVESVGAGNVLALAMPSPHSSESSVHDAEVLADNLGVELRVVAIESIMAAYDDALGHDFASTDDVAGENIQARIRGNILMAYSNKTGRIVLSTGNKSELAVGYCTLYGDMSGGLAVLSDVPKTMVYRLAEDYNAEAEVIPRAIIAKEPSAELKPGQKDSDSLPPYDVLDNILDSYVEEGRSRDDIVRLGYDAQTVDWVLSAVRRNEYKRRQAAPGLKVTSKAFGAGRRFPIAAKYDV